MNLDYFQQGALNIGINSTIFFPFLLQLVANIILFVSVNVAGIFINNVTQKAQRKTFVDTRNCIAARKEIQQENEKLVRNYTDFILRINI